MRDRRWWVAVVVVAITLPWVCLWAAVYVAVVAVGSFNVAAVLGVADLVVNLALIGVGGLVAGLVGGFVVGVRRWWLVVPTLVVAAAGIGAYLVDEALGLGHWDWFGLGLVTAVQSVALLVAAWLTPMGLQVPAGEVRSLPTGDVDRHRAAA